MGRWAADNVRFHDTGIKELRHTIVGDITTTYNRTQLAADTGLAITIYTVEPGTKSAEPLNLLATSAATLDQPARQETPVGP